MEALRVEADESSARAEELKARVKQLEAETTQKEQEITSLTHKNSVLESEVEKLEGQVKIHKDEAGAGAQAGTQAESLQRKIQVLEEEAEESDRTIRELNEKYDCSFLPFRWLSATPTPDLRVLTRYPLGSAKPTSSPATTNAKSRLSSSPGTSGNPSMRRWPRNTPTPRRSSTTSSRRLVTSNLVWVAPLWLLTGFSRALSRVSVSLI
jgi:TolA-binding protein